MQQTPIVIGLGFGDEGKGTTVDYLVSELPDPTGSVVVRFSGGPQTAHNVVTNDGKHHTFAQFGSGTFHGAGTVITEHMLVNPFNMVNEAEALLDKTGWNPFEKLVLDENALLITPVHMEANRQREINRGSARHGSCGEGVGEARGFSLQHPDQALRMAHMGNADTLRQKLELLIEYYTDEIPGFSYVGVDSLVDDYAAAYADIFQHVICDNATVLFVIRQAHESGNIVFEGSQGVLLDEVHGFHPYTTWSDTTNGKALEVLKEAGIGKGETTTIGVLRSYHTRHGDGPFPTEAELEGFSESHNGYGKWQGGFRCGFFDMVLAEYAAKATGGVDTISLTHYDRKSPTIAMSYKGGMPEPITEFETQESFDPENYRGISDYLQSVTRDDIEFVENRELLLNDLLEERIAPIRLFSYGPKTGDKIEVTASK